MSSEWWEVALQDAHMRVPLSPVVFKLLTRDADSPEPVTTMGIQEANIQVALTHWFGIRQQRQHHILFLTY